MDIFDAETNTYWTLHVQHITTRLNRILGLQDILADVLSTPAIHQLNALIMEASLKSCALSQGSSDKNWVFWGNESKVQFSC